jgi:hypothetical protein
MARITLEANTKDRRNKSGQIVFQQGDIRIKLFEGSIQDGMTLDAFELVVNQKRNWVMINSKFAVDGRTVEAREAYYDTDVIKIRDVDGEERVYNLQDDHIQSFATVAIQTRLNNREREIRRQNKAA